MRSATPPIKRGRKPTGSAKSKDPAYMATTVYVNRAQYADARDLLFRESRDFSDLVGELLAAWLKRRK
jgi:hypothetical protein